MQRELQAACISPPRRLATFRLEFCCRGCNFPAPASALTPLPCPRKQEPTPNTSFNPFGGIQSLLPPPRPQLWHCKGEQGGATKPWASTRTCPESLPCSGAFWASKAGDPRGMLLGSLTLFQLSSSPWFCSPGRSQLPNPMAQCWGGRAGEGRPCREGLTALGRGLGARGRPAPHCTHTSKPQQPRKGNTAAAAAGSCSQAGQRGSLNPFPTTSERLLESWEAAGERNPPEGQASPRRIPPSL